MISCAHSIKKGLAEVTPGMTRPDVVDEAGSPLYVHRNDQNHIWVYRYYDNETKEWVKKAVHFENDVVTKVTDAPKRSVVLKSGIPRSKKDDAMDKVRGATKGAIKHNKAVGSEQWYKEIEDLEKEQLQQEKQKVVPSYKEIN